ncbi:AAA family ATPase [Pyrobaculum calidifontis]|uniref:Arcadin-4 n=1 Tax=Pyrobaculum calidifontis (strain DSM 21063 / JCM 11548 / VA1) TaxID=410359 RepID=RKD4_PYRCJ|nr:SMC family ATPase [Pyrobaculum calidifontis]A3MWN7.1 RecName: Full=Arcadin-4 [Pyrobaculum calidifontis JCM 11548]ABO09054.1 SMC domain protein [Pyrobaculum calidifontis JCM 11548]
MWRISRVELENFRSYRGAHRLELGDVNLLWGRIGAGKTSVFYAIEYALFGQQLEVKERVAKLADLIHSGSHEARVALELVDGANVLKVERKLGKRGAEKLVVVHNGVELRGGEAERRLEELLGVDEDLYERLVYISHRTLEGFIYGTSQKRAISVDRLFGIDVIDGVVKTVSSAEKALLGKAEELRKRLAAYEKYRDVIKRYGGYSGLVSRLRALSSEIEALKEREAMLTRTVEELARARAAYLAKLKEHEQILLEYYRARSELEFLESSAGGEVDVGALEKVKAALREAAEEFEHMLDPGILEKLYKASDLEALSVAMAEVYDALTRVAKDLELELTDVKKAYEEYVARARRLEEEVAAAEARLRRLEKPFLRFQELLKKLRSLEEARARLSEARRRLSEAEREAAYYTSLKTVALYLAETNASVCPICGSPISREAVEKVVRDIDEKFGGVVKRVEELREEVKALEREVEEMEILQGDAAEYIAAKARLDELKVEREEVVKKVLQAEKSVRQLEKRIEKLREFFAKVDKRVISDAVSRYGRAVRIRELRKRVKELEERLRQAGIGGEELEVEVKWREAAAELEKAAARLAELYKEKSLLEEAAREVGEEAEGLKKRLDNVLYAYGRLEELKSRLELAKVSARARLVEVVRSRFNEVFQSLYKYGDVVKVDAAVEPSRGYYDFYAISPSGDRYGVSRLSDGQRLSIALSLALALREISQVKLGFLIFDEPIPYVDVNVRKAFAQLLTSLAGRYQLLVATQSREFAEEVREALPNAKLFTVVKDGASALIEGLQS